MSYPETTTMATASAFNLPTMAGLDFGNDDLADDMEGLTLSFPKVKIPSGGALQFELPTGDPENPEYTRFLQGVILYHHASGAYWPEGCEYDDREDAVPNQDTSVPEGSVCPMLRVSASVLYGDTTARDAI